MALVLTEPFDNLSAWTVAGTFTTPAGRTGTCAQCTGSTGANSASYTIASGSESDTVTVGFAYKDSSLANALHPLRLSSDAGATAHITLRLAANGSIAVLRGTHTGTALTGGTSATGLFTAGTWYYIELQVKLHDTTGFAKVRLNGTEVINTTGVDTKNAGTKTTFDTVVLTNNTTASTTHQWDDLYLRNDTTFQGDPTLGPTGTGAIVFAGAGVIPISTGGSGTIAFAGAGTAAVLVAGTGAIVFAGAGTASVVALFGTTRLDFAGSGLAATSGGTITGHGAIVFGGGGAASVNPPNVGHITFGGYADADVAPNLDVYAPPEWSWQALRPDGTPLGPLTAATARQLTFQLDGAATASFTMPGDHPQTAAITELATDLYVARNGRPLFRGRIGGSSETHAATTDSVTLTATDYRGLLDHRLVWPTSRLEFEDVDQADIAWRLLADTQALDDLRITRGVGDVTGVVRDRTFTAGIGIAEAIGDLAGVADGFDWEIDPHLAFNLYWPQRGRYQAAGSQPILTYGRDVVSVTTSVDPSRYGNAIYFTGATDTDPVRAVGTTPPDVGRWELQRADPNATVQTTVAEEAAGVLAAASELPSAITVTLAADIWNPYVLWLGDTVRALIQVGRLDLDVTRRIVQIDVVVDDTGVETVTLAIGAAPPKLSDRLHNLQKQISQLQLAPGGGGGGDGGGIKEITSSDGSIVVTNPTGPTTNLVLADGRLITVINPTGPVVDLTLDGGYVGGTETISVSHTVSLRYYSNSATIPDDYTFNYFLGFGSNAWLSEEVRPMGSVSRITQPGYYSMTALFTVDVPLTVGNPGSTGLDFNVDPHGANWVPDWTDPYPPVSSDYIAVYVPGWQMKIHTPDMPGYSQFDIDQGYYAFCDLITDLYNPWFNGHPGPDHQDAVVTVDMTLTRKPL